MGRGEQLRGEMRCCTAVVCVCRGVKWGFILDTNMKCIIHWLVTFEGLRQGRCYIVYPTWRSVRAGSSRVKELKDSCF